MLTDQTLSAIERRHNERKEYHDHIPSGPYFYDSLGYVHNELALRPGNQPKSKLKRVGVLVRGQSWFDSIDMDKNLNQEDSKDMLAFSDLGQYLAFVCDHDVEKDVGILLAEIRRLRSSRHTNE